MCSLKAVFFAARENIIKHTSKAIDSSRLRAQAAATPSRGFIESYSIKVHNFLKGNEPDFLHRTKSHSSTSGSLQIINLSSIFLSVCLLL